jgi:hypothetical protein
MVDKSLLRQLKGKIKTTKNFRDKIKELELEQEIQPSPKLKPPKEEIPKQEVEKKIKDVIIKKPLVKIEMGKFLIQL